MCLGDEVIRCLGLGLGFLAVPLGLLLRLEFLLGLGFGLLLGPYFVG